MKRNAMQHTRAVTVFVLGFGLLAPRARADEAEERKAEAQRLFMAGQAALEKGDNASGCPLMRQSLGLFAVANTLFNVAKCDEAEGKLTVALEHWQRGLSLIDATDRRTPVVQSSIEALEARIPRVRIVVPAKSTPLSVLLNDEAYSEAALEKAILVNPGKHMVLVRKAGHKDRVVELVLNERERTEVVADPGDPVPVPTASASVQPPPPPPPPRGSGLKTGGVIALGLGGAGAIGAIVTGALVLSNRTAINDACPAGVCPAAVPTDIADKSDTQRTLVPLNGVFWGIGIAGVGAGVLMLVLAPGSGKKDTGKAQIVPMVGRDGGGIGLSGRF